MLCWPCISISACNETNLMHYLSSVYSVTIPLHVLGLLVAHHQEVAMYICDNWYVSYVLVDCRQAWMEWNSIKLVSLNSYLTAVLLRFSLLAHDTVLLVEWFHDEWVQWHQYYCICVPPAFSCFDQSWIVWPWGWRYNGPSECQEPLTLWHVTRHRTWIILLNSLLIWLIPNYASYLQGKWY
jgi:hypothetical protein